MTSRSYAQYCGLARALDVIGERWALLVLRELLDGPLRFADLLDRLHSVSTDVLTRRLRSLEDAGLVERIELPPPAARLVYRLTEHGQQVEPVILATARFGLTMLGEPRPDDVVDVRWLVLAVRTVLGARPRTGELTVRFDTPDGSAGVRIAESGVTATSGDDADVVLVGDVAVLAAAIDPEEAARLVSSGQLVVTGEPRAVRALTELFRGP